MAVQCQISNENLGYIFKKNGILAPSNTKNENQGPDNDFEATHEFDNTHAATFSSNSNFQSIPTTEPVSSTVGRASPKSKYHAKMVMFSLDPILNIPHINLDGGLMACWSDVKETLFPGCSSLGCKIVLRCLEIKLKYPLLTKDIRNCSATGHLKFSNCFHYVEQGEIIVNLRLVKRHWDDLVDMVVKKHQVSTDATSANCFCKAANDEIGNTNLDISCDVESGVGTSHCYRNTDCSVEITSLQSGDRMVHPLPGFVLRDQGGQKELYIPLVTLLSTYQDLSWWLREFLKQLAEGCIRIPGSEPWQNRPIVAFCSERQGQIISHLMYEHGCSGPCITSRTMLVKWSYITKSYFAGNILTRCLQVTNNYFKICSRSSSPKNYNSFNGHSEFSKPNEEETTRPLRPIQNYQKQLWDYQKIKHQHYKPVTYRLTAWEKLKAHGPPLKSGAEVMNKSTDSRQLTLRKKWLTLLGKHDEEEIMNLRRAAPERWSISDLTKGPQTGRRKAKAYRHDHEKENDASMLDTDNPRNHPSGRENTTFKDLTKEKRCRRCKEKPPSYRQCLRNGDKARDILDRPFSSSKEVQHAQLDSSRSHDVTTGEIRRASSGNTQKAISDKSFNKGAEKINNEGLDHPRRASHHKVEKDRRGHNPDCTPSRRSGGLVTKDKINSSKGGALLNGDERSNSFEVETETRIGVLGMKCNKVLNGNTKGADRVDKHGNKGFELIQELKPSGKTNNERNNGNHIKNKSGDDNRGSSVVLANSYSTITSHSNNNNTGNYYNVNNNADEHQGPSNNGISNTDDDSTNKTPSSNDISTKTKKSQNMNRNSVNNHVNKLNNYVGCEEKKKAKTNYKRNSPETVSTNKSFPVYQLRNSIIPSECETVQSPKCDGTELVSRNTPRIAHATTDVTTVTRTAFSSQSDGNQGRDTAQAKSKLQAVPRSDQSGVVGKPESEVFDDDIVFLSRSVATKHGLKEKPHSPKNVALRSAQSEIVKPRPLKKNILMRESTRKDVENLQETLALACKSQDLYTLSEMHPLPKQSKKKLMLNCCNSPNHLLSTEKVKQDKKPSQVHASTSNTEANYNESCYKRISPSPQTGPKTPSPPPVGNRTSSRHPKKTLLDNFLREVKEALEVHQVSTRSQDLQIEEPRQRIPCPEIPNKRSNLGVNRPTISTSIESTSQSASGRPVKAQDPDHGILGSNSRLGYNPGSNVSLFCDEWNSTTDSCSLPDSVRYGTESEFPFAFRLECIYDGDTQRVGYVHRLLPAISVPYIMIGSAEFITVRSALRLFVQFDENCFVKCFLRDDKQVTSRRTCSQNQATLLRRINTLPDLNPTEGEELLQIGPLMYNFHRFKEAMRRLRTYNKQAARSQSHHSKNQ